LRSMLVVPMFSAKDFGTLGFSIIGPSVVRNRSVVNSTGVTYRILQCTFLILPRAYR
jgi:hypothetical protein